ncbi:MAG: 50S ribosomal protein L3 [Planctomycetes bacterium]|nr:50S ribosomal protein L3 [Planctomycetota bacterium]
MPVDGILGRKVGMTQIFDENGRVVPVTVIEAGPCPLVQLKTVEKDGYAAAQLGFDVKKKRNTTRQLLGHFKKAGVEEPRRFVREVPVSGDPGLEPGKPVTVGMFQAGQKVRVVGTSKGRGFAGTIKRHGFQRGPDSHGSKNVRAPGTNGAATTPGRTLRGRRMGGHMGVAQVTIRFLDVVSVDEPKNLIVLRGAVPGPSGGFLVIHRGS